jgi:oxygen-independent coproporphyrinogen III oxidase
MLTLYLHIPFCKARCSYCDFYLVTQTEHVSAFFRALFIETALRSADLQGQRISAIHFGGGTPSFVPVRFLAEWLDQVASFSTFASDIEIALEANPEDLTAETMDELRAAGVTRISLGVQSFIPEKLKILGRKHSSLESQQVTASALRRFDSVSLDLICGVPGEDCSMWDADLHAALSLRPQHLSVYMLSVEPKTMLHHKIAKGLLAVPDDAVQAAFYEEALGKMACHGYSHYEVSNFCQPGHHSRYNLASWMREPYLGFGPSAHSFLVTEEREIRMANVSSLSRYIAAPHDAVAFREELSAEERFTEQVFLSLRINIGLDVEFLLKENKLGHLVLKSIDQFRERGWVRQHAGLIYLTEKGFLFADFIAGALIFG